MNAYVSDDNVEEAKNLLTLHHINPNYYVPIKFGTTFKVTIIKKHNKKVYPLIFLPRSANMIQLLLEHGTNPNSEGTESFYSKSAGVTKEYKCGEFE